MALTMVRIRWALFRGALAQYRLFTALLAMLLVVGGFLLSIPLRFTTGELQHSLEAGIFATGVSSAVAGVCATVVAVLTEYFSGMGVGDLKRFGMGRAMMIRAAFTTHVASPQSALVVTYALVQSFLLSGSVPLPRLVIATCVSIPLSVLWVMVMSAVVRSGPVAWQAFGVIVVTAVGLGMIRALSPDGDSVGGAAVKISPFGAGWQLLNIRRAVDVLPAIVWVLVLGSVYVWLVCVSQGRGRRGRRRASVRVASTPSWVFSRPITAIAWRQTAASWRSVRFWVDSVAAALTMLCISAIYCGLVSESWGEAVVALVVLLSFACATSGYNAIGFDATMSWIHRVAPIKGSVEAIGRSLPGMAAGLSVTLIGMSAYCAIGGRLEYLLPGCVLCLSAMMIGMSIAAVACVYTPFHTHAPDGSPSPDPYRELLSAILVGFLSVLAIVGLLVSVFFSARGSAIALVLPTGIAIVCAPASIALAGRAIDTKTLAHFS